MKFQSDILETTVSLPRCEESSALGAGFMAGLAHGIYTKEVIFEKVQRTHYEPSMEHEVCEKKYDGWKTAISKVLV